MNETCCACDKKVLVNIIAATRLAYNPMNIGLSCVGGEKKDSGKTDGKIERLRVIVKISRRQTSASGRSRRSLFRCGRNFNNKSIAMFGKCLVRVVKLRAVYVQQIVVYFR